MCKFTLDVSGLTVETTSTLHYFCMTLTQDSATGAMDLFFRAETRLYGQSSVCFQLSRMVLYTEALRNHGSNTQIMSNTNQYLLNAGIGTREVDTFGMVLSWNFKKKPF